MDLLSKAPPCLKEISPLLKAIASAAENDRPVAAYFCLLYALDRGLAIRQTPENTTVARTYLIQLMDAMEEFKKEIKPDNAAGRQEVENYGYQLFDTADRMVSSGSVNKLTVKYFYESSLILECMKQFGELSDDVSTRIQFARAKAKEMKDQLQRTGPTGAPPQPANFAAAAPPPAQAAAAAAPPPPPPPAFRPAPAAAPPPPPPYQPTPPPPPRAPAPQQQQQQQQQPSSPVSSQPVATHVTPAGNEHSKGFQPYRGPPGPSPFAAATTPSMSQSAADVIYEAQKASKYAVSALQFNDVRTAVANLEKALGLLRSLPESSR